MRRGWMLLGGLAVVTLSCQVVLGLEAPKGVDPEPEPVVEAGPADPCQHALPPPKPAKDDDPSIKNHYWFATESIAAPLSPDAGFDLDDSCTCESDRRDGAAPCETPASQRVTCDFPNGADDAFGQVAGKYASALGGKGALDPVNRQFKDGIRTTLLYLNNYNGLANDLDVGLTFGGSGGLYTNLGCNDEVRDLRVTFNDPQLEKPPLPDKRYAPMWDGCDRWSPVPGVALGHYPDRSAYRVSSAYVSNYTIVVKIDDLGTTIFGGASRLGNGYAVAHLTPEGKSFRLDGVIAGRMAYDDLLNVIGRTPIEGNLEAGTMPFCESAFWPAIAAQFCSARDTMASPAEDFQGKVCDGTTAVVGFVARPAQVSDVEYENAQNVSVCTNSKVDCK